MLLSVPSVKLDHVRVYSSSYVVHKKTFNKAGCFCVCTRIYFANVRIEERDFKKMSRIICARQRATALERNSANEAFILIISIDDSDTSLSVVD